MGEIFGPIINLLNYDLFVLGEARITPLSIAYLILLSVLLVFLSAKLRDLLIAKLLDRTSLKRGARQAIGTISRYVILFIGFILILQSAGINLTAFNVLAGAVGIGIGLGLQNIANNFISGLIVLLERPIQVGDRIAVDGEVGEVVTIGTRSTRIRTNDNIAIIVPNSKFITENVVNWSYGSGSVRYHVPVGVALDSDIDLVTRLLIESAKENTNVEEAPEPSVRCMKFDDNGIYFELRAWSSNQINRPWLLRSELNLAILEAFREHDVKLAITPTSDIANRKASEPGSTAVSTNGSKKTRRKQE